MDSITIIMPVTVKAKLTDKLRAQLVGECTAVIEQMDLELKQLEIDMQREIERLPQQERQIRNFFGNEAGKRQARREDALRRKDTLEKLAPGAEIIRGNSERQVTLKVGDNIRDAMGVEILTEDDKIIAIRS
ncbi:MAG: 16S rRNA processing protein RimM [Quinella sp. 1Q7]|nr:16S rRNA processing protein RimM [Quinella sp. 1Q7]MBR2733151.1 16S rRNA processing protein RimM [Selenomonadaceae bacterium]